MCAIIHHREIVNQSMLLWKSQQVKERVVESLSKIETVGLKLVVRILPKNKILCLCIDSPMQGHLLEQVLKVVLMIIKGIHYNHLRCSEILLAIM